MKNQNKQNQNRENREDTEVADLSYFINFKVQASMSEDPKEVERTAQTITEHVIAALEVAGNSVDGLKVLYSVSYESASIKIPIITAELKR